MQIQDEPHANNDMDVKTFIIKSSMLKENTTERNPIIKLILKI